LQSRWKEIGLALSLLAAYFSHIVTFGFALMMIFFDWLLFYRNQRILVVFRAAIPSFVAFLLYMAFRSGEEPHLVLSWEPLKSRLEMLPMPFWLFRDMFTKKWTYFPEQLIIWMCVFVLIFAGFWTSRLKKTSSSDGCTLGILAALLISSTILLPSWVAGGLGIAVRIPYFAAFSIIGMLPSGWYERHTTRWAMALACALLPAMLFFRLSTFQTEMSDLEQAIRAIPPHMRIQPIITELNSKTFNSYPFLHAPEWYNYERGGYSPYLFPIQSSYFPVKPRKEFLPNMPGGWEMDQFQYDRHQSETDYFLVRTKRKEILDDLARHVPIVATAGEWIVFGPRLPSQSTKTISN
jgi:hypothetical protein